jgi:hypothetical protein
MTYTLYTDHATETKAKALAKGCYQASLLDGTSPWSGAGLSGKARRYSASYLRSRGAVMNRLRAAGLRCKFLAGAHNRRILVIGAH